jgi:hypothetical protein
MLVGGAARVDAGATVPSGGMVAAVVALSSPVQAVITRIAHAAARGPRVGPHARRAFMGHLLDSG